MASICSPLFLGKRLRSATFNLTQQDQAGRRQKAAVYGGFEPRLTGSALGRPVSCSLPRFPQVARGCAVLFANLSSLRLNSGSNELLMAVWQSGY
ncbi:hypothetical protein GOD71_10190 [Sinorhizobium medicae]|nr:hypothetical protein [Sinorhizobium medicae]MDX0453438.1 hypothetical protein [Sinorhizobium medicae]MDX0472687.1 hypothetical protein [Sinorhizobium medicae]MDX0502158.1 hypothetical protein [Sinorhizobium medicae]MDX0589711.1 hypothetical protein [Sinorhizobium medicae]